MIKYYLSMLIISCLVWAQSGRITGNVTSEDGAPLIAANVIIKGSLIGTATDSEGAFSFENLKPGKYIIEVSMVGFKKYISDQFQIANSELSLQIVLEKQSFQIDQVVVTAGKHEQDISELPVSALVINADQFSDKGFTEIDDALRYAPGVNVTLDQVSIRGSSGYSRGAGTRVLVAIDGIPLYTGDTGEIIWEVVPVTEIQRVEIIKGAASSLYGSTAIGGVINVITKDIASGPLTYIRSYVGVYDKPAYNEWDWSGGRRLYNGLTLAHSNKFGNLGISFSLSRIEDQSYRQGGWSKRYAGFLKAKYNFSENTGLTFLANGYTQDKGTFNFWKDSRNALVPPDGDQGQRIPSDRLLYSLTFEDVLNDKLNYKINTSLYRTFWKDDSESLNSSSTNLYRAEMQTEYKIIDQLLTINGIEGTYGKVKSNIFSDPESRNIGAYTHWEYKFDFPLTLTFGTRFDYGKLDTLGSFSALSPKFGLNYNLTESTIIRSSIGRGFRAPTLAEAFTSTQASGVPVKPNPNIDPETSYTVEFGVNQNFSDFLNLDLALFQNEYYDFIEPRIDTTEISNPFVIFDNVPRARIQGAELNSIFDLTNLNTEIRLSYMYLWARDVEQKKTLKYRPRHLAYASITYSPGIFEFGFDFRYWSKVEEIDFELIEFNFVPDGEKRVDVYVLDYRTSVNLYSMGLPAKVSLNANNLLNYNYIEMIGNISPIRNFSLNLELVF